MKISEIIEEKTLFYKLFFSYMYIGAILLAIFFYVLSYTLSLFDLSCQGYLYEYLCGVKLEEFKKSKLELTSHIESFMILSNISILLGPLTVMRIMRNQKLRSVIFNDLEKKSIYKILIFLLVFILMFLFFIYVMPFSDDLGGSLFYYNQYAYFLSTAIAFTCVFCYQFCFYCYFKILFINY